MAGCWTSLPLSIMASALVAAMVTAAEVAITRSLADELLVQDATLADDECSTDCAFSALQRRDVKVAATPVNHLAFSGPSAGQDAAQEPHVRYSNVLSELDNDEVQTSDFGDETLPQHISSMSLLYNETNETSSGSNSGKCARFGCGGSYKSYQACQCDSYCTRYGNCCADYRQTCLGNNDHPAPADVIPSGPYTCKSDFDFGKVMRPHAKGIALDDTTFEFCSDRVPVQWPNTKQKVTSVRMFKAWGMTDPKFFHTDMMKAWANLKSYAETTSAKFLLGVSVTCNQINDDREFQAAMNFIRYVGSERIMGLAVGNEIDLQVGASNPACLHQLWSMDGYFQTMQRRVAEFDTIPGMSRLPITAAFSNNALNGGHGFTYIVTKFLQEAWARYGARFVLSINVYPQFDPFLAKAGCLGATNIGTKFTKDDPPGFTVNVVKTIRQKMAEIGQGDKKLWLGEIGWATRAHCELRCNQACRSKEALMNYYKNFLKWDSAEDGVDHVFYFTLRDSSVFGAQEEFGLIQSCDAARCKF